MSSISTFVLNIYNQMTSCFLSLLCLFLIFLPSIALPFYHPLKIHFLLKLIFVTSGKQDSSFKFPIIYLPSSFLMPFYSRNSMCFTLENFRKKLSIEYAFMLIENIPEINYILDRCILHLYVIMLFVTKINFYS